MVSLFWVKMIGKHLVLLAIVSANVDSKVTSIPLESSENLLALDVLRNSDNIIGAGHLNLEDNDSLAGSKSLSAEGEFDPDNFVEVLEKIKSALNVAQIEAEGETGSIFNMRRVNTQLKKSTNTNNNNNSQSIKSSISDKNRSTKSSNVGKDQFKSTKSSNTGNDKKQSSNSSTIGNDKNQSSKSSSTGNNKIQSSKSSSTGNNKKQPSKSSSTGNNKKQASKSSSTGNDRNQSSQSSSTGNIKNQSSKSSNTGNVKNQSSKSSSTRIDKNQPSKSSSTESDKNHSSKSSSSRNDKNQSPKSSSLGNDKNKSSKSSRTRNDKNQSPKPTEKNQSSKTTNTGTEKKQSKETTRQNSKSSKNDHINKENSTKKDSGKFEKKSSDIKSPNSKKSSKAGKKDKVYSSKGNDKGKTKNSPRDETKLNNKSSAIDLLNHKGFIKDLVNYTMMVMADRDFDLLVNTDLFLTLFKEDYEALAEVAEDNDNWEKYIKSAIENFYLEFNKIYFNLVHVHSESGSKMDLYNKAYDLAMFLFATRKNFTAVRLAAPVRRIADVIKSIISSPIEMVQTSCKEHMPIWQCNIAYLSKLIAAADSCPNIWFHSLVLETILEYNRVQTLSISDPITKALGHLKSKGGKSPTKYSTQVHEVFELIMKILLDTKDSARSSLQIRAKLYQFIIDLQNNGNLDCNSIGTPLYVF